MNDLAKIENHVSTQLVGMIQKIRTYYPVVRAASKVFFKQQSQFMDAMLTVSQPTPLRSLRQVCAEIEKAKLALDEAYFKIRRQQLAISMLEREQAITSDPLRREAIQIDIDENETQIANTQNYIDGAIRKVSAYLNQYQAILAKYGKTEFTEEDFERDEIRYHIMTAFHQALTAARARAGVIDEGNHIYFFQLGISGAAAQLEVSSLIEKEERIANAGGDPDHAAILEWLEQMADKYQAMPGKYAKRMGKSLMDANSMCRRIEND